MIRAPRLLAAAFLCLLSAQAAANALTLRDNVTATGDVVTVGDFFVDAGEAAGIALFRAPAPGATGGVNALRLSDAVRDIGLDWTPLDPRTRVVVSRSVAPPPASLSRDEVVAIIRGAIAGTLVEVDDIKDLAISLNGQPDRLLLPSSAPFDVEIARLEVHRQARQFEAAIAIRQGDHREERWIDGHYDIRRPIPILALPVARGERLSQSHIAYERIASPSAQTLIDTNDIIGQVARRPLRAGDVLKASDLESPRVVTRNQLVTIVFELPGMLLTTQGRALEDAAVGEPVSVINVRSNRTVQAIAQSHGQVSVGTDAKRLAMR